MIDVIPLRSGYGYRDCSFSPLGCIWYAAVLAFRRGPCQSWLSANESRVGGRNKVYSTPHVFVLGLLGISSTFHNALLLGTVRFSVRMKMTEEEIRLASAPSREL